MARTAGCNRVVSVRAQPGMGHPWSVRKATPRSSVTNSADFSVAEKVCTELESTGFRCWIAPRDVRPGQEYAEEIVRGIEVEMLGSDFVATGECLEFRTCGSGDGPIARASRSFRFASRTCCPHVRSSCSFPPSTGSMPGRATFRTHRQASEGNCARSRMVSFDLSPNSAARSARFATFGSPVSDLARLRLPLSSPNHAAGTAADCTTNIPLALSSWAAWSTRKASIEVSAHAHRWLGRRRAVYGAFNKVGAFEVYEIEPNGSPKRILEADQFANQYQSTKTYGFTIDSLPITVVSCLLYQIRKSGQREANSDFQLWRSRE